MSIRKWMKDQGFSDRLVTAFPDVVKVDLITRMRTALDLKLPDVKPLPFWVGVVIFTTLAVIGASLGAALATYVFFGITVLAGLIAIVERSKWLRYLVLKSNLLLDLLIFGATIYATAALGVTIGAALTFTGLGFSIVYAPWLRLRELSRDQEEDVIEVEIIK